jgi:plastocyanin
MTESPHKRSCTPFLALGFAALVLTVTKIPTSRAAQTLSTVNIEHFKFIPAALQIHTGQAVNFVNKDGDPHTVTAQDASFESTALDTGDSWKHTFTKSGTYDYICTIHLFMKGTITVTGDKR